MYSRNFIPLEPTPTYRVSHRDYEHIKDWLEKCKQNYQPQPVLSSSFEYFPLNYVFTFKKITLEDNFINKYVREFNAIANNGMNILAGIYDEQENAYIAKTYERKRIFCRTDIQARTIQSLDQVTFAFYALDQRIPGKMPSLKDLTSSGINLKKMSMLIKIEFMSNDGEIFHLGYFKHNLANRLKLARTDVDVYRMDQKEKVGYVEVQIDTPDKLGLSYFIPANCIIDQDIIIPPCKSLDLKNKTLPYTLLPMHQIILEQMELTISNYDKLLSCLKRCNPYFTQHHHENIKIQIMKMNLNIGFHNSWMMLTDLPGLNYREKEKEKQNLENKPLSNKNISKMMGSYLQSKEKENKKVLSNAAIFIPLKLLAVKGEQNVEDTQTLILKSQQIPPTTLGLVSNNSLTTQKNLKLKDALEFIYFQSSGGQLVAVLQFVIKFSLNATIKQEKTLKFNIFWAPLTFNTAQTISQVKIPMISHIELPGYPTQWNKINPNNKQISVEISYKCINDNPELQKNTRKERVKTYKNISSVMKTQGEEEKGYYDLLLEQLSFQDKEQESQNLREKSLLRSYNQINNNFSQGSIVVKEQQINNQIQKLIKKLESMIKPRLRISPYNESIPIKKMLSQSQKQESPKKSSLIGKSYQIKLRLREYLPITDDYEHYYIPRKMQIKLYGFRSVQEHVALISKDSAKAGIPIQLQNPNKLDYQGFYFVFQANNIPEEQAQKFGKDNNLIATVYDLQNMLYYASGSYPTSNLFCQPVNLQEQAKVHQNSERKINEQSMKYFRIELRSKTCENQYHIRGYFLLQCQLTQIFPTQHNNTIKTQQIQVNKIIKQIPIRQRQKLRIQNYHGKDQANTTKRQLIEKYKQSNQRTFVSQLIRKQYNNDLELDYEIGKPTFGWLKLNNTDKSENNIFTFNLDCDFMELVTQKAIYQRNALATAKKQDAGIWKNQSNLSYILGKQGHNGYYEAKIPSGTQCDILIKILNNEWVMSMPQVIIVNIEVKRNTLPFRTYKIRLQLKKPLIDCLYHVNSMWGLNHSQLRLKIPEEIINEHGDNIMTLTPNTVYNLKNNFLTLSKIDEESVSDSDLLVMVLMGIYEDKSFAQLKKTIFIEIQIMQGEKIKMNLGDLQSVQIPILNENIQFKQRIYRIQTSNDDYRVNSNQANKLNYCSLSGKNQPQLPLRCLKPINDELIVSVINLEGKLIKKYVIEIECTIPEQCMQYLIQIEGSIGQKIIFVFKNPYHIDFGFYVSSNPIIIFREIQEQKKCYGDQQYFFKINGKSQLRMIGELAGNIKEEIYVVLSDCLHHVVAIYKLKVKPKIVNNSMARWVHSSFMDTFGNR